MRSHFVGPEDITIPAGRYRQDLNESAVAGLMESISKIGLQNPPIIRWGKDADGYDEAVLVTGRHRVEACKRLGTLNIVCLEFEGDETDARLWEIAENLHRAELTVQERAEHIAEWVKLTEAKAKAQLAPSEKSHTGGRPDKGINAAVRELGLDRTEAQRAVKIASLSDEAKEAVKAAGLSDNQSALLKIAKAADPVAKVAELTTKRTLSDAEAEAKWRGDMTRLWNKGSREWRSAWLSDLP